jgi:hypothetical protein
MNDTPHQGSSPQKPASPPASNPQQTQGKPQSGNPQQQNQGNPKPSTDKPGQPQQK